MKLETVVLDTMTLPDAVMAGLAEARAEIERDVLDARALVVNPELETEIVFAEKKSADLNGKAKKLASFRKAITDAWNNPLEEFTDTCKALERDLAGAATDCRDKANAGRDLARQRRTDECRAMWSGECARRDITPDDMDAIPHLRKFFAERVNPKSKGSWANRGTKVTAIRKEMRDEVNRVADLLDRFDAEYGTTDAETRVRLSQALLFDMNWNDLLVMENSIRKEKEAVERAKQADEERRRLAERYAAEANAQAERIVAEVAAAPEAPAAPVFTQDEPIETYRLAVTGTRANLVALREWCAANGVTLKLIK